MRLFTGIALPPSVLTTMGHVLDELRPTAVVKWSPIENLHITCEFIGELPEESLPGLVTELREIPKRGNIAIGISGFGYFPNPHRPHSLYAGVHAGPELTALARARAAGEPPPYMPHLTLARIKNEDIRSLREHIASMTNFDFGSFEATQFHLYLSERGRTGSAYSIVGSFPLAPGAAV